MPTMPTDVLARRRRLTLDGDADGFADLFAPDAVIEAPFAGPPGSPARLEGREVIREYSRHVMRRRCGWRTSRWWSSTRPKTRRW